MNHTLCLPGTDVHVLPIGLGAASWNTAVADRMLGRFLDAGGQVVDTARLYGFPNIGMSERAIGQWIRSTGRRSELFLISKGGHPRVTSMHKSRMSAANMEADLHASLRALHTDVIDLYFYHRDDIAQPVGVLLERMEAFREAGKIRWYGCSNWTTDRMREAEAYAQSHGLQGFLANECLYNMAADHANPNPDDTMVTADAAMLEYHRSSSCLLMPYSGLCNGFYHKLCPVYPSQPKRLTPAEYATPANIRQAEVINRLCEQYHASITQVLTGFFFTRDVPMLPLFGCSTPEHLDDVLAALQLPFCASDYTL